MKQKTHITLVLESWADYLAKRPRVDLRKCKPGQRLLTKNGLVVKYVNCIKDFHFPHQIEYENGGVGSRTDEGWVLRNAPLPSDEDIIYIFPMKGSKAQYAS